MESNTNIKTAGFTLEPALKASLDHRLFRLSDICPYDSSLNVTIEKKAVQYEFSIVLHFVGGRMEVESHGTDLEKATNKALDKLYERICQWHTERFETPESEPVAVAAPRPPETGGPSVLIVDDDPLSTQFLDHCLKKSGCQTHFVSNGHAAVDEIASNKYDLIFLDWNMPGMNGSETLLSAQNLISYDRKLNSQLSHSRIPVITYSGEARKDIRLPQCDHFRFVDHWDKSTPFHQLMHQASDVLFRFKTGEGNSM
jgi:CheY-like chemotaxis protein/ribosome-associated translation inhibitor RaiA